VIYFDVYVSERAYQYIYIAYVMQALGSMH